MVEWMVTCPCMSVTHEPAALIPGSFIGLYPSFLNPLADTRGRATRKLQEHGAFHEWPRGLILQLVEGEDRLFGGCIPCGS